MRDGPDDLREGDSGEAVSAEPAAKDEAAPAPAVPEEKVSLRESIFLNPAMWALNLGYLLVYVCRQGLGIWGIFYLLHRGARSNAAAAALFSGFELGGFF